MSQKHIDRLTAGLCAVCRGREVGRAVHRGRNILWCCHDPECIEILDRSAGMKQSEFDRIESEAAIRGGGGAMGKFLEEAGYGDLFDGMPPEVWAEAVKRCVGGYRTELKRLVDENAPPF